MTIYPDATEGAAYTDMSAVDSKILLRVGCIHIVYLHKFLMSLLVSKVLPLLLCNVTADFSTVMDFSMDMQSLWTMTLMEFIQQNLVFSAKSFLDVIFYSYCGLH